MHLTEVSMNILNVLVSGENQTELELRLGVPWVAALHR